MTTRAFTLHSTIQAWISCQSSSVQVSIEYQSKLSESHTHTYEAGTIWQGKQIIFISSSEKLWILCVHAHNSSCCYLLMIWLERMYDLNAITSWLHHHHHWCIYSSRIENLYKWLGERRGKGRQWLEFAGNGQSRPYYTQNIQTSFFTQILIESFQTHLHLQSDQNDDTYNVDWFLFILTQ